MANKGLHLDYSLIEEIIEPDSKVLDLGCGSGELIRNLIDKKNVVAKGIEIDSECVISSIQKGVCTIQGDIDEGLNQFSDDEYDYVILNSTLQSTEKPDYVIREMLRVGKKVIVSFPNFAYWKVRLYLMFIGKMPKSKLLPFEWYDTPNIHLLTINDFFEFTQKNNIKIIKALYLTHSKVRKGILIRTITNLLAQEAIFVLTK